MEEKSTRRRRGGSLVFPILLIVLGLLFLLDNLNITSGIDWGAIWKLWPVILIALGLEVLLGRRISFGAVLLIVIVVVVAGGIAWWSVAVGDREGKVEYFTWDAQGVERAELELNLGLGELRLAGQGDMGDLLSADLDLAPGDDVNERINIDGDVARGHIASDRPFLSLPGIFGGKGSDWDLQLNTQVRWELDVNSGLGETWLDLSDLRVSDLNLDSGAGSVDLVLPRRGSVRAMVDGGIGDLRISIPEGVEARISVDRGLGDLTIASRFERRGDYYESEGFSGAESYVDLEIKIGVGAITIR
jgi:hypothetical protein